MSKSIADACFGSSLVSIVGAATASGLVRGQAFASDPDHTVEARLAVEGAVRPRYPSDSRKSWIRTMDESPVILMAHSFRASK